MPTVVLAPNGATQSGNWVRVGGSNPHGVLADTNDGTYMELQEGVGASSAQDYLGVELTDTVPAGIPTTARIRRIRALIRGLRSGAKATPIHYDIVYGGESVYGEGLLFPEPSVLTDFSGAWVPGLWPWQSVDDLTVRFHRADSLVLNAVSYLRLAKASVEVEYTHKPTTTIGILTDSGSTVTSTTRPRGTITYTDPDNEYSKRKHQVRYYKRPGASWAGFVFNADGTATHNGQPYAATWVHNETTAINPRNLPFTQMPSLDNGVYRAYGRTSKDHWINTEDFWSDWAMFEWTQNVALTATPSVRTRWFPSESRLQLSIAQGGVPQAERFELERLDKNDEWQKLADLLPAAGAGWGYGGNAPATNAASPFLIDLEHLGVSKVLWLPGITNGINHASTPNHADLNVTGDLTLEFDGALASWTPSVQHGLIAKRTTSGYSLDVNTAGLLRFVWVSSVGTITVDSTVAPGFAPRSRQRVRASLDVDNGAGGRTIKFERWDWTTNAWVQIGANVVQTGVTDIVNNASELRIGNTGGGSSYMRGVAIAGRVYAGLPGALTLRTEFLAENFASPGTTAVDSTGKTWTINRAGDATSEIVDRSCWALTGSEYLTVPHRSELDFIGQFAVALGALTRTTTSRVFVAKRGWNNAVVASSPGFQVGTSSNQFSSTVQDANVGVALTRTGSISGAWRYLYVMYSGTALQVVADGTGLQSPIAAGLDLRNTQPLRIGAASGANGFMFGMIPWVAVFSRALTATEGNELASWNGKVATEPGWLRDAAVLYVNADDPVQRLMYRDSNTVVNLVVEVDYNDYGVVPGVPNKYRVRGFREVT